MSGATDEIAALDGALADVGEDIVLGRPNVTPSIPQVTIRGRAVGYQPHEIIAGSGIVLGDLKVIMTTSQLDAANWPGSTQAAGQPDPRIPQKGDSMFIGGRRMTVRAPAVVYRVNNAIVRMEVPVGG